jgi:enoyl-CoA hydratase/carnithine racemase
VVRHNININNTLKELMSSGKEASTEGPNIVVEYRPEDKIAVISLNRPKKFNALSFAMFGEFEKAFTTLLNDPAKDVRAIVLTSTSKNFTAGLDLNSAMEIGQLNQQAASSEDSDVARVALAL